MAIKPPGDGIHENPVASGPPRAYCFSSMFTGIVEETGVVERIQPSAKSIQLAFSAKICARGLKIGDSIAVNGCCLTVVKLSSRGAKKLVHVDLLAETWKRTNLQFAKPGSLINLERPLRADGRLDALGDAGAGETDLLVQEGRLAVRHVAVG